MHWSLTPRANLLFISAWALLSLVLFAQGGLRPAWSIVIAAVSGGAAGVAQHLAIRNGRAALQRADSAIAVREGLTASPWGKASIYILWVAGAAILAIFAVSRPLAAAGTLGSLCTFFFCRDLIALPAVFRLGQS